MRAQREPLCPSCRPISTRAVQEAILALVRVCIPPSAPGKILVLMSPQGLVPMKASARRKPLYPSYRPTSTPAVLEAILASMRVCIPPMNACSTLVRILMPMRPQGFH